MLYVQEYCVAAAMGTVVLAAMYFLKRNYSTRSNRLFLNLILINLVSSVLNVVSIRTISYPQDFSPFARLAVNLGYLWVLQPDGAGVPAVRGQPDADLQIQEARDCFLLRGARAGHRPDCDIPVHGLDRVL